ncbi:MAG: hypothetical protein ACAH12_06285 [Methylophilaceae bacterium]
MILTNPARIGGDFELTLDIFEAHKSKVDYSYISAPHLLWLDTGRSALMIIAKEIVRRGGSRRIWLPAYGCESISQAFSQEGFELKYYSIEQNLDFDSPLSPRPLKGDTLLCIHYFGHLNKQFLNAIPAYMNAGVWVIEDFVQSGLIKNLMLTADFAVTSYRKLLPVPDGAMLASKLAIGESVKGGLVGPDEAFISEKIVAKILRGRNQSADIFLPLLENAEKRIEGKIIPRTVSWFSTWVMSHTEYDQVLIRRRENWSSLLIEMNKPALADKIKPMFNQLDVSEVPLGMPVIVLGGKRDFLRRYLMDNDIYCAVHWPLVHLPNQESFPFEMELSRTLLTLPIDQRLDQQNIQHMVSVIHRFFREN